MKRSRFIFYENFSGPVKDLSDNDFGTLFRAVFDYVFQEKSPENLTPMLGMAFKFIQSNIDADTIKYQRAIEKNRENGSKGGRPKKPKKPSGLIDNPSKPKKADMDMDMDMDIKNEKEEKKKPISEEQKFLESVNIEFKDLVKTWMDYKAEKRSKYKGAKSLTEMYEKLKELSGGVPDKAKLIVKQSMGNNWQGLFALKENVNGHKHSATKYIQTQEDDRRF